MSVLLSFVTKFDLRGQDCITGMSRLADASVDLVVTSPPYNLGISYGKYSDRQDRRSYLGWCGEWAGANPPRLKIERFLFSQHRRRAVESDAAARNRDDVARVFRAAKHDSLD